MVKKILSFVILVSTMFTLSSCLSDKEDTTVYYDDTAVTGFSLGTVNQYLHTTARDGVTDSVYKTTYNAKDHAFSIDQVQRLIYNVDSLPYGTDVKKLVCTMTSMNSGLIVLSLKSKAGKDSLVYYNSTDSLDLSTPTKIRVYNMMGSAYRDYTLKVNVHQEQGTEMRWNSSSTAALLETGRRQLVSNGTTQYLFGVKDGHTVAYVRNGSSYEPLPGTFSAEAYNNVTAMNGQLYMLNEGSIMRSADGRQWDTVATAPISRLLGAGTATLYALTQDGIAMSTDEGKTWTAEQLDDDAANLPNSNVSLVCLPSDINTQTSTIIIVGTRDGKVKIWRKTEENGGTAQQWAFYPEDDYNHLTLPALANLRVIAYDGGLLALGGNLSACYTSKDQGITWQADQEITLAQGMDQSETPFALTVDSRNIISMSQANSATVWSGRLARLGWQDTQKAYIK